MNKLLLAILGVSLCGDVMADNFVVEQAQNVEHVTTLPWDCERYDDVPDLVDTPDAFKDVDYVIGDICEIFRDLINRSPRGADLYRGVFGGQVDLLRSVMEDCVRLLNVLQPGTDESDDISRCLDIWRNSVSQTVATAVNSVENADSGILIPLDPNTISLILSRLIPTVARVSGTVLSELHDFTREKNFPEGNGVAYHSPSFFDDMQTLLFAPEELAAEQVIADVEEMSVPQAG